jgi:hypothetical protein
LLACRVATLVWMLEINRSDVRVWPCADSPLAQGRNAGSPAKSIGASFR